MNEILFTPRGFTAGRPAFAIERRKRKVGSAAWDDRRKKYAFTPVAVKTFSSPELKDIACKLSNLTFQHANPIPTA